MDEGKIMKISLRIIVGFFLGIWCITSLHHSHEERCFWIVFIASTFFSGLISIASEFIQIIPKTIKSSADFTLMWMIGLLLGGLTVTFFPTQLKFIWHLLYWFMASLSNHNLDFLYFAGFSIATICVMGYALWIVDLHDIQKKYRHADFLVCAIFILLVLAALFGPAGASI